MIASLAGTAILLGASVMAHAADPAAAKAVGTTAVAHPEIWPKYKYPVTKDAAVEAKIADLLKRMTVAPGGPVLRDARRHEDL
jgi:beta-glucosidase